MKTSFDICDIIIHLPLEITCTDADACVFKVGPDRKHHLSVRFHTVILNINKKLIENKETHPADPFPSLVDPESS